MNLFFVGYQYDFPDRIPVGEAGSTQRMAANYNDVVSLMRHQMKLFREKNQQQQSENARLNKQNQQQQDEIARLKQEQHKLKQGQQKV